MYRTFFVFAMAVLMSLPLCAKGGIEHFSFKGIPIDGTLSDFQSAAEAQGFETIKKDGHTALLFGEYAGSQCRVLVESLPSEDCVWGLTAYLPSCDSWKALYSTYETFKKRFSIIYGRPVHCTETFFNGELTDDSQKYLAVKQNKYMFKSVFETETGQIDLVIWNESENGSYVLVSYIDKVNSMRQE